jgi:hypothetical protein
MPRGATIGLYIEGPAQGSVLQRLPRLGARIGPVASSLGRVATRAAGSLKNAWVASSAGDIAAAGVILIVAPDARFDAAVAALAAFDWQGQLCVACDARNGRQRLKPLVDRGAVAAALVCIDPGAPLYLIDAAKRDRARVRALVRESGGDSREMDEEAWSRLAAITRKSMATLLDEGVSVLRGAGVSTAESRLIVEREIDLLRRAFLKGSHRIHYKL